MKTLTQKLRGWIVTSGHDAKNHNARGVHFSGNVDFGHTKGKHLRATREGLWHRARRSRSTLFTLALTAFAISRVTTGAAPAPETVIVPYDATKPIDGQKLDQLYVPYEHFIELWNAAKMQRRPQPAENPAAPFVFTSSRYDARLGDKVLHVSGALQLFTYGTEWVTVPMPFAGVTISALKLDGEPAALLDPKTQPVAQGNGKTAAPAQAPRAITVEKAGAHLVEVEFEIPLAGDRARVAWNVPQTAGTLLQLVLPRAEMKATISPGAGAIERVADGKKIVTAMLGVTGKIEIALDSSIALAVAAKPAVAHIAADLDVTQAFEAVRARIGFSFPESRLDRFTVFIDKNLTLLDLAIPNLKSWKLDATANPQRLEVTLSEPVHDRFEFVIAAERAATLDGKPRAFPFFAAEANRFERVSALNADTSVAISARPTAAFKQIPTAINSASGLAPVAAFSSIGGENLAYEVAAKTVQRSADVHAVYQVNHTKIELVAAMTLDSREPLFSATLAMPADFAVQAVESERLRDWWRDGDALNVRFRGVAPGQTHLVLHLVKQFAKAPAELEIAPLALADFSDVHGDALIAADKGVRVTMTALADAKEVAPENVAKDFDIALPLERKRGIVFKNQNFSAKVALAPLPARLTGLWILFAQAHESWIGVSAQVHVAARQASAGAVSFTLPAGVPEARVSGDNVRETSSYPDGDVRRYRVFFRADIYEATDFTVSFDLPHAGATRLPSFEFPELERVESFVIAQNASDYEMQVNAGGLDTATRADLPFLPPLANDAHIYRAHPGWSLEIRTTALAKDAGRSAFVAWAEMTSALRDDGGEWHRAVYHLQNRSLQFLPVKLPAGAELTTVRVAGDPVRADKGRVNGADVVLVPLIKTKAGDLAYDVELVYRTKPCGAFDFFARKKPGAPELPGITVERTFWNVWLPENERLVRADGNMEEVIGEVAKAEKLEGAVQELKSLSRVIASNPGNSYAYDNATRNYDELSKRVKQENESGSHFRREAAADAPVAKGKAMQQRAYVSQKQMEFKKELEQQAMQVDDLRKAQPNAPAPEEAQASAPQQASQQPAAKFTVNSGYVGGIEVQSKSGQVATTTDGNKLLFNDNIAWNAKVDVTQNSAAIAPQEQGRQQVEFLGDISIANGVLKQGADKPQDGKGTQVLNVPGVADLEKKSDEIQGGQNLFFSSNASNGAAIQQGQVNIVSGVNNTKALNNARGNTYTGQTTVNGGALVLNGENTQAGSTILGAGTLTTSGGVAMDAGVSISGKSATQSAVTDGDRSTTIGGVGGPGGGAGFGGDALAKPRPLTTPAPMVLPKKESLKTGGRVSLAVDFPTEGRVHHFKKLKADARLTLSLASMHYAARFGWFALFVALSLLLRYTARQHSAHTRRRAS